MSKLINLTDIVDADREDMAQQKVNFRKFHSQLLADARKDSKPEKCLNCNELNPQLCNSHTLPAFILKRIAVDGKLYTNNMILDSPLGNKESGVNNSSTFHIICRNCDSKIFADYENPENYQERPTDRMIAQIAMKNYLRQIGKRQLERSLYTNINNKILSAFQQQLDVIDLDLSENIRGFKQAKKALEKGWGDEYYLFFYEKLDYVVPLAFQGQLNLLVGLDGEQINNVFNKSKSYKIQPLHVSVFPLENETIVTLFVEKEGNRYRRFRKSLSKLPLQDKLAAINYMIFCLSEEVYLNKEVHEDCLKNKELRKLAGLTSIHSSDSPGIDTTLIENSFSFSNMKSIPNFLIMDINKENLTSE